jgi:hypothetical protein
MIKLILTLILFVTPVLAFSQNWNHIGNFRGYSQKVECYDSVNCYFLLQRTRTTCIFKTSDAGLTWDTLYKSPDPITEEGEPIIINARHIESPNPKYYFIGYLDRNVIKKSIDSGKTFKKIAINTSLENGQKLYNIKMYDENFGLIHTMDTLFITEDGWETWKSIKNDYILLSHDFKFIDKDNIILWCYDYDNKSIDEEYKKLKIFNLKYLTSKVLFIQNDENSITKQMAITNTAYLTDSIFIAVGSIPNGVGDQRLDLIYKTTDGGYTWEIKHQMEKEWIFGLDKISCYDKNNCMAVGNWGKVIMTRDGGETWVYEEESYKPFIQENEPQSATTLKVTWAGKTPIIATFAGNLYRYEGDFFDFGTSVEDTQPINTTIFPNPSSDKILLDLGGIEVVDLVVYDILGNEIMSIKNYSNKNEIDISTLSIGTYTIQIQSNTGRISQRLLVNR